MTPKQKRWARIVAAFGVVAGIACHYVPPEYQTACNAVAQIASLCGAGSP